MKELEKRQKVQGTRRESISDVGVTCRVYTDINAKRTFAKMFG